MHHPTDRIAHTTGFVTPVVEHWLEREIAQWVHPIKDHSDDPSHHERTLLPRSYISLPYYARTHTHTHSFQPVLHDWCNKGHDMCYIVCGMVHIKEPLLLIDKSSLCGSSGFPFSLSEWSLTICLMPYNRR